MCDTCWQLLIAVRGANKGLGVRRTAPRSAAPCRLISEARAQLPPVFRIKPSAHSRQLVWATPALGARRVTYSHSNQAVSRPESKTAHAKPLLTKHSGEKHGLALSRRCADASRPAIMATDAAPAPAADEPVSPKNTTAPNPPTGSSLDELNATIDKMEMRADPDAQATVTDFLDFTEYLPSDIVRSLTLIGKLDQTYAEYSSKVDELTTTWGQLPGLPLETRPQPTALRAEISEHLRRGVASRMYTYAEATKMTDNINRHYNRAQGILAKLQTTLENLPAAMEEQKSPVVTVKSPQIARTPKPPAQAGEDVKKVRRKRVPRIIIPGEVLAPHELNFDAYTSSDESSSPEPDSPTRRMTPAPSSRIRLVNKTHKTPKPPKTPGQGPGRPPKPVTVAGSGTPVVLQPPPENALPGSVDAPWLQLTAYELAKLRKKMKKNAVWTPSDTMIARELKALGRGPEAYRAAKKKAEDDGQPFNSELPAPVVVEGEPGTKALPEGAISVDTLEDDISLSNKGMKLNEAKKLKREAMAKQAVEEAEQGNRMWAEAAKRLFVPTLGTPNPETPVAAGNGRGGGSSNGSGNDNEGESGSGSGSGAKARASSKRKRDAVEADAGGSAESAPAETQGTRSAKRLKTETPVPPPQLTPHINSQTRSVTPILPPPIPQSTTPVPIPLPRGAAAETPTQAAVSSPAPTTEVPVPETSGTPAPDGATPTATVSAVPTKSSAELLQVPSTTEGEMADADTAITPSTREQPRRETRQGAAKKQQQQAQPQADEQQPSLATTQPPEPQRSQSPARPATAPAKPAASRDHTPTTSDPSTGRRPTSRGKAASQEPSASLAADRPRRSSTARNTPAPEHQNQLHQAAAARQPPKTRRKRPAPGIVSASGPGANSAVGRRKAAPRKKARAQRKDKGQVEMEEVDDEGNVISADEARYCLCNRVSFGTMIECDNADVSFLPRCCGTGNSTADVLSRRTVRRSGSTSSALASRIYRPVRRSGTALSAEFC